MKDKIITACFLLTAATSLYAQETKQLTLQNAIELSIKNSKNLQLANAKTAEATAELQNAYNNRLPNFKISGSYLRLNSANVNVKSKGDSTGGDGSPKISSAAYGIANLSLPLYAGGRIKYGIESAKLLEEASKLDAENDKDAVAYNASQAYINLYKAATAVQIVSENLRSALARDSNFSNLEKNGLLARNDLLKSQLQTS
ncbi:MAG: TolC family protein, partial [Ginsengibacter sp.]